MSRVCRHVVVKNRRRADDVREVVEEISWKLRATANGYLERTVTASYSEGVLGFHGLVNTFKPLGTRVWTNLSQDSRQHVLEITAAYLNSTHLFMRISRDVQELGAICLERPLQRFSQVGTARIDFEPAGPAVGSCPLTILS